MKTANRKSRRLTTSQSVIQFVEGSIIRAKGKDVSVGGLYYDYRRFIERFGKRISKERFYRILDRHGYRRRVNGYEYILENFTRI